MSLGKILFRIAFCVFVIFSFGKISTLRPPAVGALYKEFIVGGIVLAVFYLNRFCFYWHYFYKGKTIGYLLLNLICLFGAVALEMALVYPQLKITFAPDAGLDTRQYLLVYSSLMLCRDFGFFLASHVLCDFIRYHHLTAEYEYRLSKVGYEIPVNQKEEANDRLPADNSGRGQLEVDLSQQKLSTISGKKEIKFSNFLKISDILYLEQFRNTTLIHTMDDKICIRYSSLLKTMVLIGMDNLIQVSKNVACMKKQLHSFDEKYVYLYNPVTEHCIQLMWSDEYYKRAASALRKEEIDLQRQPEYNKEPEAVESLIEKGIPKSLLHDGTNQLFFYIAKNKGCKIVDMSKDLHISTATVNRILKQLKDEGLVEYVGSKKTGGYRVCQKSRANPPANKQ